MQEIDTTTAKLLLIDDEVHSVKLMEAILKQAGYRSITASNDPRQAIELFRTVKPDLLVLDMRMPHLDGIEVMRQLLPVVARDEYFPILIVTGELDVATKHKALAEGAKDFLTKPVDAIEVALRIKNQLLTRQLHDQLRRQSEHLEAQVLLRTKAVEQTQLDILHRLALAAGYRHDKTGSHAWRVGRIAALLAELRGLSPDQVELIRKAAPLHDVGKIGIPDEVLLKAGPFTEADREVMRQHVKIGSKLLSGSVAPLLQMAREIALTHHERWDGTGYLGIKGTQIPLSGRIAAVADAFDVMTHRNGAKSPMTLAQARAEIENQAGKQFDPELSAFFLRLIDRDGEMLLSEPSPVRLVA